MSEPSQWGPPRYEAAPRPTAPYPTAPHPNSRPPAQHPPGQHPGAPQHVEHLPTMPMPAVRQQAPRGPAPSSPPADRADYGTRDDLADDRRDDYSSGRSRTRGQFFSGLVIVLVLIVSALLGTQTYQMLASIDLVSSDPFADFAGWATTLGALTLAGILLIVLAVVALVIARPKALAGLGLAASLLLPLGAVVAGLWFGGDVLRQNVESDIAAEGPAVAAQGAAAAADALIQELENRGVDAGPLRDLITGVVGQGS
jgi:hypothetical protein